MSRQQGPAGLPVWCKNVDRRFMQKHDLSHETDAALLTRFVAGRDQCAFTEIVRRHGPMVMGVSLRILGSEHDAEDAFQATFLTLAKAARQVRRKAALAAWLHQTAVRAALAIRKRNDVRLERESLPIDPIDPQYTEEQLSTETKQMLDREIAALPAKYRSAITLCHLEGLTRKEAAARLGLPLATVTTRVTKARELLRKRLQRRGVTLTAGVIGLTHASPEVSLATAQSMTNQALLYTAGKSTVEFGVSQTVIQTTQGILAAMMRQKITNAAFVAVSLFFFSAAVTGLVNLTSETAAAGQYDFDDFDDMNIMDDSPFTWLPGDNSGGIRDASSGDLVYTPPNAETNMNTYVSGNEYGNVSLRTRFSVDAPDAGFITLEARSSSTAAIFAGIRARDGRLSFATYTFDEGTTFIQFEQADFNAIGNDVNLRLDVVEQNLSLWAWPEGEPMPSAPSLTALIPAEFPNTTGTVGLALFRNVLPGGGGASRPTTFRFFQTAQIPEPTSVSIAALAGACLFFCCIRRRP